jgi:hypothetical protein
MCNDVGRRTEDGERGAGDEGYVVIGGGLTSGLVWSTTNTVLINANF